MERTLTVSTGQNLNIVIKYDCIMIFSMSTYRGVIVKGFLLIFAKNSDMNISFPLIVIDWQFWNNEKMYSTFDYKIYKSISL